MMYRRIKKGSVYVFLRWKNFRVKTQRQRAEMKTLQRNFIKNFKCYDALLIIYNAQHRVYSQPHEVALHFMKQLLLCMVIMEFSVHSAVVLREYYCCAAHAIYAVSDGRLITAGIHKYGGVKRTSGFASQPELPIERCMILAGKQACRCCYTN